MRQPPRLSAERELGGDFDVRLWVRVSDPDRPSASWAAPPQNYLQPHRPAPPLKGMLLRSQPRPKEILSGPPKTDTLNPGHLHV